MSLKNIALGGTTYEVLPLKEKFVISAKWYLGFIWLFQSRRMFVGKGLTFGSKSDLTATPSNFTFTTAGEAQGFVDEAETTYQAIRAL